MSNIFDALQRAESESSGTESPRFSLATELLQAAERKMREAGAGQPQARVESSGPISAAELLQAAEQKMREADAAQPQARMESPAPTFATELLQATEQKMRGAADQPARGELIEPTSAPSSFDDLERCPVLRVSIPQDSRLVAVGKEESLGAEKFRFLAVRLRQLRQSRPLKKILITSTIPQEGKSTVAANLACTLARRKQQKTLLLEGDLRRPTLAARFGLGRIPGLCEWLSGQTDGINLYRLESLGLWVLPAGAAPQNPLELMQSGKLAPLDEPVGSLVRLDRHRFSPGAAAGGRKHVVPAGRRNFAGHSKWHDRETATAARSRGDREVEATGSISEQQHKRSAH